MSDYVDQQIQDHLILGPVARHGLINQFLIASVGALILTKVWGTHWTPGALLDVLVVASIFIYSLKSIFRIPAERKLRWAWVMTKILGGCLAGIFLLIALADGNNDRPAWPYAMLGLIWLPGLEFLLGLAQKQKYLTVLRVIGTLIVVHKAHWL